MNDLATNVVVLGAGIWIWNRISDGLDGVVMDWENRRDQRRLDAYRRACAAYRAAHPSATDDEVRACSRTWWPPTGSR